MGRGFASSVGALLLATTACGSRLDLGYDDAGAPDAGDCRIGTYSGTVTCMTTSTSGVPFNAVNSGTLSLVLDFPDAAAPPGTLVLTSASALASSAAGVTSSGQVLGTLDCPTRYFAGLLTDYQFRTSSFSGMLIGNGTLTATYVPDAGPPGFFQGVLMPPNVEGTSESCTWSATLR
jgi:hypothetical protein